MSKEELDGVWRTVRGRRIFIKKGESLGEAMSRSGKFKKLTRTKLRETKDQLRENDRLNKSQKYWEKEQKATSKEKFNALRNKAERDYNKLRAKNSDEIEYRGAEQAPKNRINENAETQKFWQKRVLRNYDKYSDTDKREIAHENLQKKLADYKAKKQSNNKVDDNYYKGTKRQGFGYANDDNIPVYDNKIDYSGDFTHANLSKVSDDDLKKIINKQTELYNEAVNRRVGDRRTYNGKKDQLFKDVETLRYSNGMKVAKEEAIRRENERHQQYKGTDYEVKYYSVADALNDPNSKIRQFIDKKRSNRKNKDK